MNVSRKIAVSAIVIWTFVVTMLRAVRMPNDYAEALWFVDYRFGFVKRGLIGTIVSLVRRLAGLPASSQAVAALAYGALLVFSVVLIAISLRVIRRLEWTAGAVLVTAVFVSSPFVVMSAHLVGYYDNMVVMLGLASVVCLLKGRIWLGAVLQSASVLVHETTLVVGLPLFCLTWVLITTGRTRNGSRRLPFLPLLLPVVMFAVLAVGHRVAVAGGLEQNLAGRLAQVAFIGEDRAILVPRWMTTPLGTLLAEQSGDVLQRLCSVPMYGLVLPAVLAVLCFTVNAYRIRELSIESALLVAVCLAPQALHLVAWDTARIWTYTIFMCFGALWVYTELRPAKVSSGTVRFLALACLMVNILVRTPVMDGIAENFYLKSRLLLYLPVVAGLAWLLMTDGTCRVSDRLRMAK